MFTSSEHYVEAWSHGIVKHYYSKSRHAFITINTGASHIRRVELKKRKEKWFYFKKESSHTFLIVPRKCKVPEHNTKHVYAFYERFKTSEESVGC